jgi:hypothetical protein
MTTNRARTTVRAALSAILVLALGGCDDTDRLDILSTASNLPAVGATAQGLGFTVVARNFGFDQTYASPTMGDTLAVALTVTSYGGGSALLEITDAGGTVRHSQTITSNLAQGQTTVTGTPPYHVRLRFTGFSGVFVLGVAAQGT